MAERNQAVGLFLTRVLGSEWASQLPVSTHQRFQERLDRERLRSAVLDSEVESIVDEFRVSSIRAVHFGAASYRSTLYAQAMERPTREIDLLVFESSDGDALRKLGRLGYRVVGRTGNEGSTLHLYRFSGGPQLRIWRRLPGSLAGAFTDRVWAEATKPSVQILNLKAQALVLLEREVRTDNLQSPLALNDLALLQSEGALDFSNQIPLLGQLGLIPAAALVMRCLGIPDSKLEQECGGLRKRGLDSIHDFGTWLEASSEGLTGRMKAKFLLGANWIDSLSAITNPQD